MNKKQKMLTLMMSITAIYLIAIVTGIAFLVFLIKGEWIRAGIVLLIELALFFLGKTLRKELWQ